ncbi:PIN domain-containing protein [Bombiscardovia apis]|uniref:PIN domain-containing protein n=1 Tax=Bombiscardovia apis TaxID=2932182 RepID=A0ABM8BBZ8_9BIFI|nr:PIN domain-containing protein [Bombiscardovia apis]BDR54372.1 PIN domain-containing protein [Bombiscardovia apis]
MLEAAFLDANLFVPTWTLDAFLSLAEARAYEPFWSDKIMEEARVAIQEVRQVSKQQAQQVLDAANKAFPMALTQGWETLEQDIALPDIDDRHVLAAARLAGAQTIVTFNLKHFPQSALAPVGLEVQSPDAFLSRMYDGAPELCGQAMRDLVNSKHHPPRTMQEEIEHLNRIGLPVFARRLAETN